MTDLDGQDLFPVSVVHDAVVDGWKLEIGRNRGILVFKISPAETLGGFAGDPQEISVDIDSLNDGLVVHGLKVMPIPDTHSMFPLDKEGKPLCWPHPDGSGWYVDAWNGIYDGIEHAATEVRYWVATEDERVLDYGEGLIDEEEKERRMREAGTL